MSYTDKIAEWRLGAGHIQSLFLMPVAPLLAQTQLSDKNYEFTTAQMPPLKIEKGKCETLLCFLQQSSDFAARGVMQI